MCAWWDENTYLIMWKHIFGYVDMRVWWYECTYLVMLGYGHDESVPYAWRNVRNQFRGCFVCISLVCVDFSRCVRCIIANRQQCFGNPFATKWQTVSSRRGRFIVPAYRKMPTKWGTDRRIWQYENTCAIMWICGVGKTDTCVWRIGYTDSIMWKHVFDNE